MYITGTSGDDVNEYDLSTAWDVSTAAFLQTFSVAAQEITPTGLFFKPDGSKMYIIGSTGDDVNEYNLITPWDVSTASATADFSVIQQENNPQGLFFKPDGLKMYVIGVTGDDVNEYDLSVPWLISSASYIQTFSVAAQETAPTGLFFKPDGLKMYVIGQTGDDVNEYDLSTAWDVSTAAYIGSFWVLGRSTNPSDMFFSPDGNTLYVIANNVIVSYPVPTAWNINSIIRPDYFQVAAQEAVPQGLFFDPDGLKMYVTGNAGDDVNEYNLSIAWDVSTAAYLQNFSITAQEGNPQGLFFKPDGLKMYVVGSTGDNVNEYDLSTAWDVSTATYVQQFSVLGQDTFSTSVSFKPDGLKMYVVGQTGRDVNEYDLSTAWDITTATYLQNFSVAPQETGPQGLFFKPDGTKMFIVGGLAKGVTEYDLSTAWDVSSATYLQVFSWPKYWENDPDAVFFKPDGNKMYIVGSNADAVYVFDLT